MSIALYKAADLFFFAFHTILILFNTFGWIFRRFRFYNLITLSLTAFSWFILGIWYGWGYCLCTDWHWTIRSKLGYQDGTNSYIDLLVMKITGIQFNTPLIETVTVGVYLISIVMSTLLNIRDLRRRKKCV